MSIEADKSVVAVVQLPPPVSGLSAVNARMIVELELAGRLRATIDIAPSQSWPTQLRPLSRLLKAIRASVALVGWRSRGVRTLYMPCDGGAGLVFNLLIAASARLLGLRLWTHHHSFAYLNCRSRLMSWLIKIAPQSTVHLVLCDRMTERLLEHYGAIWEKAGHSAVRLPNAFMMEAAPLGQKAGSALVIGHLSNLTEEKGAIRFLRLFKSLREAGVPVRGQLAGPAKDRVVASAIEETLAEFPDAFGWLGAVYGSKKDAFYDSLDVFVFPSAYVNEAQPLVLLEALSRGAAILTTDLGCMKCDHADSPGRVFEEKAFDGAAFEWLETFAKSPDRSASAKDATERFKTLKAEADAALRGVLETI